VQIAPPARPRLRKTERARRTLASIVREHGKLPTARAVDVAFAVGEALANAHQQGIVHGSLGMHCVRLAWPLVDADFEVDIFAYEEREPSVVAIAVAATGWQTERASCLAPELRGGVGGARGAAKPAVTARADVYSLGALLESILDTKPTGTLRALLDDCLAEDPAQRPATIEEVQARVASYATWAPRCFERLAARREAAERARLARAGGAVSEGALVLARLDDAAIAREIDACGADEDDASRIAARAELPDLAADDDDDAVTVLATEAHAYARKPAGQGRAEDRPAGAEIMVVDVADVELFDEDGRAAEVAISEPLTMPLVLPEPAVPVEVSEALTMPLSVLVSSTRADAFSPSRPRDREPRVIVDVRGEPASAIESSADESRAHAARRRKMLVLVLGAAAPCVVIGLSLGLMLTRGVAPSALGTTTTTVATMAATASPVPPPAATTTTVTAAPPPTPQNETAGPTDPAEPAVPTVTPASLPDVTFTPSALPDAR